MTAKEIAAKNLRLLAVPGIAAADGVPARVLRISGTPDQHPVLTSTSQHTGQLVIPLSPGLQAYDLNFG